MARRTAAFGAALGIGALGTGSHPAEAFQNRIMAVEGKKTPGKMPGFLGAYARQPGALPDLAGCGRAPNCFSSAATSENNTFRQTPEVEQAHSLEPWRYSRGGRAKAFEELEGVVRAYKPGQRGVDGGGFEVKKADPEKGYLYVQFEALRGGYIDDVEFLIRPDASGEGGEVRVRSASRQGFKDSGVNAKRLNGIAEVLSKLAGWTAPLLTNQRFPEYIRLNQQEGGEMMSSDRSLVSVLQQTQR